MYDQLLAPRAYIDNVIAEMRKLGFERVSLVTMESDREYYHPFDEYIYAKETTIVFMAKKAMIIQLTLTEHFGLKKNELRIEEDPNWQESYWHAQMFYLLDDNLTDNLYNWFSDQQEYPSPEEILGLDHLLTDSPFNWGYKSIAHEVEVRKLLPKAHQTEQLLDVAGLVAPFGKMLIVLSPYLARKIFTLSLLWFTPTTTFPASVRVFLTKFWHQSLYEIVTHLSGLESRKALKSA